MNQASKDTELPGKNEKRRKTKNNSTVFLRKLTRTNDTIQHVMMAVDQLAKILDRAYV